MTQPVLPTSAFADGVPANLTCGFCHQPVQKRFYRAINRFACDNCAQQVNAVIAKNSVTPAALLAAAGAGAAAALAGGAIWAITVHITNWNIGYLAFGIGYAVGKTVHFASGKRRSIELQWLAAVLALIGVAVGKIAIITWQIVDALHADGVDATVGSVARVLQQYAGSIFQPFDLVWLGFAAFAAWRFCKAPKISIAGPYAYEPTGGALQFQTVEPLPAATPAKPAGNP